MKVSNYDFKDVFSENLSREENIKAYHKLLHLSKNETEILYDQWKIWYVGGGYRGIERTDKERNTNIGKTTSGKTCNIRIKCLENEKIYNSINEASHKMKLNYTKLIKHLKGTLEDVKGYHFQKVSF